MSGRSTSRIRLSDAALTPFGQWFPANRGFYDNFRAWLQAGGYGPSALNIYGAAARLALGLLDKPYWQIDLESDIARVEAHLQVHYTPSTQVDYHKGLLKLVEYLHLRCPQAPPPKPIHWEYYLHTFPEWLATAVRAYLRHCQRAWLPETQHQATKDALSHLTLFLRWAVQQTPLTQAADITPALWYDYVDARLAAGISPVTLNGELSALLAFLKDLAEQGCPLCARALQILPLKQGPKLPRDVPLAQLRQLLVQIETDAASPHTGIRRMGLLDRAWFLLMLHSGLRIGEVRRLRRADLDLQGPRVRIEQSKGLKDRLVPLSPTTVTALRAYLDVRGPANSEHVFIYRHQPLSDCYCSERLLTYGARCGTRVTPHQLRHSCATLLLNAGAPILTVQTVLGHKHIDTTLGYARLYDGTVAADYYRAMSEIEPHLALAGVPEAVPPTGGQLLALVEALRDGTLNAQQQETVHALRAAILRLTEPPDQAT